jgi:hypothetical protein
MIFYCLKIWKVRYNAGFKCHTKHMCIHNSNVYQDNAGWWWRWDHEKHSANPYKNTILAKILCNCAIQGMHLMDITKAEGTWKLRCSGQLLKKWVTGWGGKKNCTVRSFVTCTLNQLWGCSEWGRRNVWKCVEHVAYMWKKTNVHKIRAQS